MRLCTLFMCILAVSGDIVSCFGQNYVDSAADKNLGLNILNLGEDTRVVITPVCQNPLPGIWFVHVHEDESTAIQAAIEWIDSARTGCFVTLKHGMGRNIGFTSKGTTYKFDPNRMFTPEGRIATLKRMGNYSDDAFAEVSKLADLFTGRFIDNNRLIVALHNNTNDGGLTIKSYEKGGAYADDAEKVHVGKKQDSDDFFYTTSSRAYEFFKKRGFNVLLQNNARVTDDGSLSVYAGIKGIDYINIETEHGKKDQQKWMLTAVAEYISAYYVSTAGWEKL